MQLEALSLLKRSSHRFEIWAPNLGPCPPPSWSGRAKKCGPLFCVRVVKSGYMRTPYPKPMVRSIQTWKYGGASLKTKAWGPAPVSMLVCGCAEYWLNYNCRLHLEVSLGKGVSRM